MLISGNECLKVNVKSSQAEMFATTTQLTVIHHDRMQTTTTTIYNRGEQ